MRQVLPAMAVVLVVAGCGSKAVHSTTPAVTSPAATTSASTTHGVVTHGKYHYPPVVVRNYMKSCVGTGGAKKRAYCACTLDKLSNNVSTEDFARIGLSNGTIPPRIRRFLAGAVAACANQL